ncbi:hypothetical protein MNB_SV-14-246 [hydrothermal vent metagenome]|uniref:Uncharacterized protein n=1 Tax=hydrothermal vent metagenome TaxID=652676 RepID=A0A1W1BWZ9_9ZZZZ
MSKEIKLFSQEFEAKKDSEYFKRDVIKGAYLIGAYAKAIIDSSYKNSGGVVSENETFKKWLSNQQIIQSNLKRIFNKANEFERKFNLGSKRNRDLSTLVTTYFIEDSSEKVLQQEVSFSFVRGFNDYAKFKKENLYQGEQ